jgi:hypothetical protein
MNMVRLVKFNHIRVWKAICCKLGRELMKDTVYERYRRAKYRSRDSEICCLYCLLVK